VKGQKNLDLLQQKTMACFIKLFTVVNYSFMQLACLLVTVRLLNPGPNLQGGLEATRG